MGDPLPDALSRFGTTYSGQTVQVLRGMVLSGKLAAGERLNEVEIAAALGISRGPLREAIQHLASEGLLRSVSHRGSYVRTFTSRELRELYELRIALETHAVRLAAASGESSGVDELRQLLVETDELMASAPSYPSSLDFHQRLVLLSANGALFEASVDVHRKIYLARLRSGSVPRRARQALHEHEEILEHLAAGDGDRAAQVLGDHLRSSLDAVLDIFESSGVEPGDSR